MSMRLFLTSKSLFPKILSSKMKALVTSEKNKMKLVTSVTDLKNSLIEEILNNCDNLLEFV